MKPEDWEEWARTAARPTDDFDRPLAPWWRRAAAIVIDAVVVDEEEVGDPDVAEVHAEGVDPEVVGELGVAGGDVAGHTFVEAALGEHAEGGGQALLAVETLLLHGGEGRRHAHLELGHDSPSYRQRLPTQSRSGPGAAPKPGWDRVRTGPSTR